MSPTPESRADRPQRPEVIGDGVAWVALWSGRWILIALAAVVLGLLVGQLWSIVLPVALALVLASVLERPARALERRLHLPPAAAAASVLLGGIAVLVGLGFAIAPLIGGQVDDIVDDASSGLQEVQDWVQGQDFVSRDQIDSGIQAVQDRLGDSGSAIASGVLSGVGAATSATVTVVITLILTFLFLKDGRRFLPLVERMAGASAGGHLAEVLRRSWTTLGGYIRTQAVVSAVDAVLIGIALVVVGVPLAIPLALLTFVGGFVPIVGAFVVGAAAVLVALVSNGPTGALVILVVIVLVQQLEGNVLSPWLQAKSMQLHAAVVLLSVTLGSTLFGITGAFLAVPVVAVVAVVIRYLDEVVAARAGEVQEPERAEETVDEEK
ncbi:AI-2E family transporter [Nocardioides sp.]|uniref:AI-2E family transporter n=1 Tax=Nocardioides sp. TaxID=35761 RepID=UPI002721045C|nr:AI-2E family transporter [Nocardioides sp.]MDO9456453.1 AI-2E family transporter [Nocardioides sp.]